MKVFYVILSSVLGCSVLAASESKVFDSKGLKILSVENTSGKVSITTTEGVEAMVLATKNKFSDKCQMTLDRSGSKLVVKVEKKSSLFFSAECDVDFQIQIPKNLDLSLAVGSGELSVKGVQGSLTFTVGSGDISADGIFNRVEGKSGSGNVAVKGLTGGGELKTGSGKMDLIYAVGSLIGALDLKTGSGDATILFPKGTKVGTSFMAGSGQLSNELGDDPGAAFKVSMKAGAGDLKIKSY